MNASTRYLDRYTFDLTTGDLTSAILEDQRVINGRVTEATTHHVTIKAVGGGTHRVHRRHTYPVDLHFASDVQAGFITI